MAKVKYYKIAPNGLLSDKQTKLLKSWIGSKDRHINQRDLVEAIGISRNKLYQSFEQNPERPFDELKLKTLNKLLDVYNADILLPKDESTKAGKLSKKQTKVAKKRINDLISKVEE
ncbi:hypothetical protein FC56_GL001091 [Lentilactobacillus senioris DSM 24302 = JCM 17472]|uniref:Uncharacterized protein n=1 Tax=Lentilactobacillus senioris DSM 24302 = JCM 17472 TaxID=1423802 RepID=A0A0R2CTM8_9LACO|nr:helix-turn-helix domain-containing protein [Lentilactobacillus senioris]KRM94720.1 hypothetical protein FC56_GL001091 [Lentilactobacillus senioris DSM 24302 = JCM 17472]